ncbi:uncharacterized protein KZ484_016170 [Pholidichthys leucotaenia]
MADNGRPERTCGQQTVTDWFKLVILLIVVIIEVVFALLSTFYYKDCPKQPFIPIYSSGLLTIILVLCCCGNWVTKNCCCLATVFFICWFVTGNIAVYSIYEPNYNRSTAEPGQLLMMRRQKHCCQSK